MKVTIKTLAEAAKVSRGTVDRVLNNRLGVSDEVRQRVKKIADELGYKVNWVGKSLSYQNNPIKIGVIILSKEDELFKEIISGIKLAQNELKNSGISVQYCVMESIDVNEQIRCIHKLEKEDIRALALSPLDAEIIRDELNRLSKKDIKIVTFNTDISGIEKLCFVGQDLKKSGRVGGQLIASLLPNGGDVAIITGPNKIRALEERKNGFEEIINNEYSNIKIVDMVEVSSECNKTYLNMMDILIKHPSLNAVFITGGGIREVGKAIHKMNRKNIKFVCFDSLPETVKLVKDNTIDFTITQEPISQGYLPIKIIFNYFFLNELPKTKYLYTKLEIKIKENI